MSNVPPAVLTPAQYKEYIFEESTTEGERLALQHSIFKPHFQAIINRVLDEYGLADRLTHQQGEPIRILDVGSGEGLYMHDIAENLENRHLLDPTRVQLIGLDMNVQAIATAHDFARLSQPPRSYLEFYTHDLTTPFASNPGLANAVRGIEQTPQFDFIYALMVFEHIRDARKHIGRLYDLLKPGGTLYLRDLDTAPPPDYYDTSAMGRFVKIFNGLLSSSNNGQIVAYKSSEWLTELGATEVWSKPQIIRSGGTSREGMLLLKDLVYLVRTTAPVLVRLGLLTQAEHDELLQALFSELSPQSEANVTFVDTLARKP